MATEAIYKYLKTQNRPYSVNDIVSNMHNEYGKAVVQKAVDQLVADRQIFEKVYGKQKIYCVLQNSQQNSEELMRIDKELQVHANEVESKCHDLEKEIRAQEATLAAFNNCITLEEARKEKQRLEESVGALTQKLDELMDATGTEDLVESKRKADKALNECSKQYTKIKRLCTEIIDCILENYPSNKSSLYEDIGIEVTTVQ